MADCRKLVEAGIVKFRHPGSACQMRAELTVRCPRSDRVGAWIMPDGDLMTCFTQANGPVQGRPKGPAEALRRLNWPPEGHPGFDMTGLDLRNRLDPLTGSPISTLKKRGLSTSGLPTNCGPGDVIAPVIDTLIELRGTADSPLKHLTIFGLTTTLRCALFTGDAARARRRYRSE